ncbi:MAG: hypothetical protein V8Q84_06510 [Bilophila sp.]
MIELLAENLIKREDVVIFGMGCNGTGDVSRVLAKLPEAFHRSRDRLRRYPEGHAPTARTTSSPCRISRRTSAVNAPSPTPSSTMYLRVGPWPNIPDGAQPTAIPARCASSTA